MSFELSRTTRILGLAAVAALGAFALSAVAVPARASSSPTLDQEFVATDDPTVRSSSGAYNLPETVQTFTAGTSNALSRVDLQVYKVGIPLVNSLRVTIYGTDGEGKPANLTRALATSTAPGSTVTDDRSWVEFNFSNPAQLTFGTRYTIALTLDGNGNNEDENLRWAEEANTPHRYSGGAECNDGSPGESEHSWYCGGNLAMGFRTYMGGQSSAEGAPSNELPNTGSNSGTTLAFSGLATGALVAGSLILWRRRARR